MQAGSCLSVHSMKADLRVLAVVWQLLTAADGQQGGWLALAVPAVPEQYPALRPQQLARPAQHA